MERNSIACHAVASKYEPSMQGGEKHAVPRTAYLPTTGHDEGSFEGERTIRTAKYREKKTRRKELSAPTINESDVSRNTEPQASGAHHDRNTSEDRSSHSGQITCRTNTHTKKGVYTNHSTNGPDRRASQQAKPPDVSTRGSADSLQGVAISTANSGPSRQRHGKKSIRSVEFFFDYHFRPSGKYDFNPEHIVNQHRTHRKPVQKKGKYVQARYRFIVSNGRDVKNTLSNPDATISWDSILLAILSCTEEPTCYICLSTPVFPNVSRCGHMFCCSCLFQYFTFHENSVNRLCPVCVTELIPLRNLRPVLLVRVRSYAPGSTITFQLLKRVRRKTRVYKVGREGCQADVPDSLPLWEEEDSVFNRLMLTNKDLTYLLEEEGLNIDKAIREVEAPDDNSVLPYYVMAKEAFRLLIQNGSDDPSKVASCSTKCYSERQSSRPSTQIDISGAEIETEEPYHFFYQCDDGQYIFLHKLCLSWLYKEYEKKENLPTKIEGKIVDLETHHQFHGKNSCLQHLPSNCVVKFALIEMDSVLRGNNLTGFNEEKKTLQKKKARQERLNRRKQQVRSPPYYMNSSGIVQPENYDSSLMTPESFPEIPFSKKTTVSVDCDSDWIKVGPGPILSANRPFVTEEAFPALSKALENRVSSAEGVNRANLFHGKSFYEAVCQQKPNSEGRTKI